MPPTLTRPPYTPECLINSRTVFSNSLDSLQASAWRMHPRLASGDCCNVTSQA